MGTLLKRSLCLRPGFSTTWNPVNRLSSAIENWLMKSIGVARLPLEMTTSGDGCQSIAPSSM